jgi:hypothetical protein
MNQQPDHTQGSQADRIDHLVDLIMKYKRNCIDTDEHHELDEWIVDNDLNMHLFEDLTNEESMKEAVEWMSTARSADALKKLKSQLHFERPRRRFSILTLLLHCTIAASLLLLLTLSLVVINKE